MENYRLEKGRLRTYEGQDDQDLAAFVKLAETKRTKDQYRQILNVRFWDKFKM